MKFIYFPHVRDLDRMSQVINKISENGPETSKSFIEFFKVCQKTGEALIEYILHKAENDVLNLRNCSSTIMSPIWLEV